MAKYQTTPDKRFKLLSLLVVEMSKNNDVDVLLDKLEELAFEMDNGNKKAIEALTYYEDNILAILSEGKTVAELN